MLDCNAQRPCGLVAAVQTYDVPTLKVGGVKGQPQWGAPMTVTMCVHNVFITASCGCSEAATQRIKGPLLYPAGWIVPFVIVWTLGVAAVILTQVPHMAWWLRCPVLKPDGCFTRDIPVNLAAVASPVIGKRLADFVPRQGDGLVRREHYNGVLSEGDKRDSKGETAF